MFIKLDMSRDVYTVGLRVKASVSFMSGTIAKKHTHLGPVVHFVIVIRPKVRLKCRSKDFEKRVVWLFIKKMFNRRCFDHR